MSYIPARESNIVKIYICILDVQGATCTLPSMSLDSRQSPCPSSVPLLPPVFRIRIIWPDLDPLQETWIRIIRVAKKNRDKLA